MTALAVLMVTSLHTSGIAAVCVGMTWLLYTYVLYPGAIAYLASRSAMPVWPTHTPQVSMIISAFNEEEVIGAKVSNTLALEYPSQLLDVWISSDGSNDRTAVVARNAGSGSERVRVLAHPKNVGKTASLMATLAHVDPEVDVVVFSDANSMYRRDALTHLVAPFSDPRVGAVAGELQYDTESAEGHYRRYENALKRNESRVAGCLTAEGSIFAVRRSLVPALRSDEIEDIAIPLAVAIAGGRVVYQPSAISVERFDLRPKSQYVRRRRIVSRALKTTWRYRGILNPFRCGALSIMYFSHRVLRWFSPFALLIVTVGAADVVLAKLPTALAAAAIPSLLVVLLAVPYGLRNERRLGVMWAAIVALAAITAGVIAAFRGQTVVTWVPARPEQADG